MSADTPEIVMISAEKNFTGTGGSRVSVRSALLGQRTVDWDYAKDNPLRAAVKEYLSLNGRRALSIYFDHETIRGHAYRVALAPIDALEGTP